MEKTRMKADLDRSIAKLQFEVNQMCADLRAGVTRMPSKSQMFLVLGVMPPAIVAAGFAILVFWP